jgi:hypothetical protein
MPDRARRRHAPCARRRRAAAAASTARPCAGRARIADGGCAAGCCCTGAISATWWAPCHNTQRALTPPQQARSGRRGDEMLIAVSPLSSSCSPAASADTAAFRTAAAGSGHGPAEGARSALRRPCALAPMCRWARCGTAVACGSFRVREARCIPRPLVRSPALRRRLCWRRCGPRTRPRDRPRSACGALRSVRHRRAHPSVCVPLRRSGPAWPQCAATKRLARGGLAHDALAACVWAASARCERRLPAGGGVAARVCPTLDNAQLCPGSAVPLAVARAACVHA